MQAQPASVVYSRPDGWVERLDRLQSVCMTEKESSQGHWIQSSQNCEHIVSCGHMEKQLGTIT